MEKNYNNKNMGVIAGKDSRDKPMVKDHPTNVKVPKNKNIGGEVGNDRRDKPKDRENPTDVKAPERLDNPLNKNEVIDVPESNHPLVRKGGIHSPKND